MKADLPFALALALALGAGLALAPGSSAAPEDAPLHDAAGDCAVPYGNANLDVVAAWISDETAETFTVNVELAEWVAATGEGAGFAVSFTHDGTDRAVVAANIAPEGGWAFWFGEASPDEVQTEDTIDGAFDAGPPALLRAVVPKRLLGAEAFANGTTLTGFRAFTADIRPMYPFIAAGGDGNGKWILCDEAVGNGGYVLAPRGPADAGEALAMAGEAPAAATGPEAAPRETPAGGGLAAAVSLFVAVLRRADAARRVQADWSGD